MTGIDDLPIRDELRGKTPYGAPQLDVPVQLNTNENPYPLPEELVRRIAERVSEAARTLNRYPDRDAIELRTALAAYLTRTGKHPVARENVWAANGSNEVIQQLLQTFGGPGRTAIGFEPSYSMHALIARGTGTGWISGPRREDFTIDVEAAEQAIAENKPHVVFITSPNNPTGTAVEAETVLALYEAAQAARVDQSSASLVIVDEAYVEFSHRDSLLPLIEGRPNMVVSRTMSKAFGAAGLRLGYLAAHPAVVDAVQLVRLPYHLSAVTQATALAALEHTDTLLGYVEQLKAERDRLVTELRAIGCEVTESDANFIQFGKFEDSHTAWQKILDQGVLVRDNGVPGWLRVTMRHPGRERRVPGSGSRTEEGAARMSRIGRVERTTKETSVLVEINLDGTGKVDVSTGVGFYDHMLDQLGRHGLFDLTVKTDGDLHIDSHHTIEDTALALGAAFKQALGDKVGIYRFGNCTVPLDESLAQVTVDLSGRPYLVHTEPENMAPMIGEYDTTMTRHIFESFVAQAQIALHIHVPYGRNAHHIVECQFKALARALRYAAEFDPRAAGILPSTKGAL